MIINLTYFFFLNYFLFARAAPYNSISEDLKVIRGCNSTFPTNKRILNVALVENHFEKDVDENFKCFLHCVYDSYKWMNSGGVFQTKEMKAALAESNLDESSIEYLLATCTEIDVEDKCERAYLFTECFWAESEKLVLKNFTNNYESVK